MWKNPIVEEVSESSKELAEKCGFDIQHIDGEGSRKRQRLKVGFIGVLISIGLDVCLFTSPCANAEENNSRSSAPLFVVLAPTEGEILDRGAIYTIRWNFSPKSATNYSRTHISLEDCGIETIVNDIVSKPGENSYTWRVRGRSEQPISKSNRLMVSLYNEADGADNLGFRVASYSGTFTVRQPGVTIPSLTPDKTQLDIESPKGGEKYSVGEDVAVRFSFDANFAAPPHARVSVDLYKGDIYVGTIAHGMYARGGRPAEFRWCVGKVSHGKPMQLVPGEDYRLRAYGVIVRNVKNWNDPLPVVPGLERYSPVFSIVVPSPSDAIEMKVRQAAMKCQGSGKNADAVAALKGALEDHDAQVRSTAAMAILNSFESSFDDDSVKHPIVQLFIRQLHTFGFSACTTGIRALSRVRTPEVRTAMLRTSHCENPQIRREAVVALTRFFDPEAQERLVECLADERDYVRGYAHTALGKQDPRYLESDFARKAVATWIQTLQSSTNAAARQGAAEVLARVKDARATKALIAAANDQDDRVRETVARSLSVDDRQGAEVREGMLKDKSAAVRLAAAWDFANRHDRRALRPLLDLSIQRRLWLNVDPDKLLGFAYPDWPDTPDAKDMVPKWISRLTASTSEPRADLTGMQESRDDEASVDGLWGDRLAAVQMLGWMKGHKEVVEPLTKVLRDASWRSRWAAARGLGRCGDERAIPALVEAINDPEERVASAAIHALHRLGGATATQAILMAINHTNTELRTSASFAILDVKDERNLPALVGVLGRSDNNGQILVNIVTALDALSSKWRTTPAATEVAARLNDTLEHGTETERRAAAETLRVARLSVKAQTGAGGLADRNARIRRETAYALAKSADQTAVDPLIGCLQDPDQDVREGVIQALGAIGGSRAVDALLQTSREADVKIRMAVLEALGRTGDERAIDVLLGSLNEPGVQYAAVTSLAWFDDPRTIPIILKVFPQVDYLFAQQLAVRVQDWDPVTGRILLMLASARSQFVPQIDPEPPNIAELKAQWAHERKRSKEVVDLAFAGDLTALMKAAKAGKTRPIAVYGLGLLAQTSTVSTLIGFLEDKEVCVPAAYALGRIADHRAIDPLILLLDETKDDDATEASAFALGKIGDKRAAESLLRRLNNSSGGIEGVAWALARFRDKRAVPQLIKFVDEKNKGIIERGHVLKALSTFGGPEVLATLVRHLGDDYGGNYAVAGLRKHTGQTFGNDAMKWEVWLKENGGGTNVTERPAGNGR